MKLRTLGSAVMLLSIVVSGQALAGGKHKGNHKPKPLEGCYDVVWGSLDESPANGDVVGTHRLVLMQRHGKRKPIVIAGPIAGREDRNEHSGEEGEEHEEGGSEKHGQHAFGTFDRSGVLLSYESDSGVTGVECFDDAGVPSLIHGFETLTFYGGTGAYSGLTHGTVYFDGSFDRCTDPNNPVASFEVASGEICFQE